MLFIRRSHPLNTRKSVTVDANAVTLIMPTVLLCLLCLVGCCDGGRKHGVLGFFYFSHVQTSSVDSGGIL
jgi:hypothetical protein